MDITLLAIAFFVLLAIVSILLFLFKSVNKKTFKADDGSVFKDQSDLDVYQKLYVNTKELFTLDDEKGSSQSIMGFEKSFLTNLTKQGFPDLKSLVKYRKQIQKLSDLINT